MSNVDRISVIRVFTAEPFCLAFFAAMSEKGQALLGQLSAARAEYNKPRRSNVRTMHDLVPLQPAPERRRTKKRKVRRDRRLQSLKALVDSQALLPMLLRPLPFSPGSSTLSLFSRLSRP